MSRTGPAPLQHIVDNRLHLGQFARGRIRPFRFPEPLETYFKADCRQQAMLSRVTTTLVTALLFLTAPAWAPAMLGVPESTRDITLWVSLFILAPVFMAITWAIHRRPASVWTENALMLVFLIEAAAIEALSYQADQIGYRVSPAISVAVPVGVLALCRLPVLRSLLFVAAYGLVLAAKDWLFPEMNEPRTPTETLTVAVLINLVLVSSAFSQKTRRQNWALLQLQRARALRWIF